MNCDEHDCMYTFCSCKSCICPNCQFDAVNEFSIDCQKKREKEKIECKKSSECDWNPEIISPLSLDWDVSHCPHIRSAFTYNTDMKYCFVSAVLFCAVESWWIGIK